MLNSTTEYNPKREDRQPDFRAILYVKIRRWLQYEVRKPVIAH